jgi:hypothetical protein
MLAVDDVVRVALSVDESLPQPGRPLEDVHGKLVRGRRLVLPRSTTDGSLDLAYSTLLHCTSPSMSLQPLR